MVYIPPTLAIQAGIGITQGVLGFLGDKAQDDRLRRQTQQDNRNRLLAAQDRFDQWNRRKEALELAQKLDIEELKANYQAAQNEVQRATESGLTRLSDLSDNLIAQAESRNRNLARVQGKYLATGQTGKTTRRLENLPKGEAARATAFAGATQERAEGAYMFNQKRIREEARIYMDNLYRNQQRRNYDPGPVPFFEGFQEAPARTAGRNLFNSLLGTAGTFAGGLVSAPKSPITGSGGGTFGTDSSLPIPSFGGNRGLLQKQAAGFSARQGVNAVGLFGSSTPFSQMSSSNDFILDGFAFSNPLGFQPF